jgi:hypothetical protein
MKYEARSRTYIDERGFKITHIQCEQIPEPDDEERELEQLKSYASFGEPGNKWERLLRAKEENIYARDNSARI